MRALLVGSATMPLPMAGKRKEQSQILDHPHRKWRNTIARRMVLPVMDRRKNRIDQGSRSSGRRRQGWNLISSSCESILPGARLGKARSDHQVWSIVGVLHRQGQCLPRCRHDCKIFSKIYFPPAIDADILGGQRRRISLLARPIPLIVIPPLLGSQRDQPNLGRDGPRAHALDHRPSYKVQLLRSLRWGLTSLVLPIPVRDPTTECGDDCQVPIERRTGSLLCCPGSWSEHEMGRSQL